MGTFHPFSRLPAELREAIWRECLPRSVCELDTPHIKMVWYDSFIDDEHPYSQDSPCTLIDTMKMNARPPAITRICRESRAVAFRAGQAAAQRREDTPADAIWTSPTILDWTNDWRDRVPDIVHMYWTSDYDFEYFGHPEGVTPINFLASMASAAGGRASMMVANLGDGFSWEPYEQWCEIHNREDKCPAVVNTDWRPDAQGIELVASLRRLPSYLVVTHIIIAHTDWKTGAASGLFGHLGDAPIQIIDMTDDARMNRYYDFAEKCERGSVVNPAQDFTRRTAQHAVSRMRELLIFNLNSDELLPMMKPAVMFRLCTLMCNHTQVSNHGS